MVAKSIKIWTIAFLSADLLFWLLVGYSCIRDSVSCFETVMFGSYFFYLPFTLLPWAIPVWLWSVVHGLIGVLVGWVLRHHQVRWWLAVIIAWVVLFGTAYGFSYWQMQQELTRETKTQFWLVDNASKDELRFFVAQQLPDGSLSLEDGHITYNLAAFDTSRTTVSLLNCQSDGCSETTGLSYTDYLVAKTTCHKTPQACQYGGLERYPTLFEVTSNPKGIIVMRQLDQVFGLQSVAPF